MAVFVKLSPRQQQAVLRRVECPGASWLDIARAVGAGERTVRRWFSSPSVRAAYADASRDVYGDAVTKLRTMAMQAADTLAAALREGASATAVRAAVSVFSVVSQTDLEEVLRRVEALERRTESTQGPFSAGGEYRGSHHE